MEAVLTTVKSFNEEKLLRKGIYFSKSLLPWNVPYTYAIHELYEIRTTHMRRYLICKHKIYETLRPDLHLILKDKSKMFRCSVFLLGI